MLTVTVTFAISLIISALAAFPADWARRRSTREVANLLNIANVTGMLAAIGIVSVLGIAHGFSGVLALLPGLATGQQLADALASRAWGATVRVG